MTRIAFVGLGNMGLPMAKNLVKGGYEVAGYDLSRSAVEALGAAGGLACDAIPEAAKGAAVVVTMLPTGRHVRHVYCDADGVLTAAERGAVLIDSSTIDIDTARVVAERAAERELEFLDAPVSGGIGGAAAGTLTFMVGGSTGGFDRARPVLEAMGKTIVHAGPAGSGQAAKICNNMMLGVQMISVCEGFALAERLGLDPAKLFEISSRSSGQCWSLTSYCPVPGPVPSSPANRGYEAGFQAGLMLKDLRLSQEAASSVGATTPLGAAATALYGLFANAGRGETDFSGIIEMLRGRE
jgi:3-hydroxyisobutyrate dehydrogenase